MTPPSKNTTHRSRERLKRGSNKNLQALWNTRLDNQDRILTTKHKYRIFILHAFEEVHYISLRDEDTYYKMVSTLELLAHFAEEIGGLEVTDVVTLIGELPGYWNSDPQVLQFIMTMEEAHKSLNGPASQSPITGSRHSLHPPFSLPTTFPTIAQSGTGSQNPTRRGGPRRTPSTPSTRTLSARHA